MQALKQKRGGEGNPACHLGPQKLSEAFSGPTLQAQIPKVPVQHQNLSHLVILSFNCCTHLCYPAPLTHEG